MFLSDYQKVEYLVIRFLRRHAVLAVAGTVLVACLVGIFFINGLGQEVSSPQRVAPDTASSATLAPTPVVPELPAVTVAPMETPTPPPPQVIEASDILNVSIASIALNVDVSGQTTPRKTENCKGAEYCIDPPVPNQAAWYGETPSIPSVNPVLLFGHTSWRDPAYATFNNLLAMLAGDLVVVTTQTGVFTYKAEAPVLVPYVDAPQSETIFGWTNEKLVLVTCNDQESAATVVVAYLVSAEPLG